MSIKDMNKVVNVYNGTTGKLISSFNYLELLDDGADELNLMQVTNLENISFNKVLKVLLENKDDVNISIGYKE